MKRARLPLTALRAFESAGRLGGFSRAAEELFVSQAAISRQIRELESMIGAQLFARVHRGVELTDKGRVLLSHLTQSFDRIDAALAEAGIGAPSSVKVSAEPTFAALWLAPCIEAFQRLRPDIDVEIDADPRLAEFRGEGVDLAIRHSRDQDAWARVETRLLFQTRSTPVMSVEFLERHGIDAPADLLVAPLLHEENRSSWAEWFAAAGVEQPAAKGTVFADGGLALQPTLRGHGAALFDLRMIASEIASGQLAAPFETSVDCGSYYLVARSFDALPAASRAFAEWIQGALAKV